jgi:epoxyqueuosine reductase QueG
MKPSQAASFIQEIIVQEVSKQDLITGYRNPIIGFVSADDPRFSNLSTLTGFKHLRPGDLLPGARAIVSFFLPFTPEIVSANQVQKDLVAREWAVAYHETNALIGQITSGLIEKLSQYGIQAAAEPATGNFDETALRSRWSHKSIAVMSGIGSFGLHQLVITDAGCAGRFGSLVIDVELPTGKPAQKERCEYFLTGACIDCVLGCPVDAIDEEKQFNRQACWQQCLRNAQYFLDLGDDIHVCGKCAVVGPCALGSAA